jgi:hypothetical protein
MSLFPAMPGLLADALVAPLQGLHRLWWAAASLVGPKATPDRRLSMTAGSLHFVARKPPRASS